MEVATNELYPLLSKDDRPASSSRCRFVRIRFLEPAFLLYFIAGYVLVPVRDQFLTSYFTAAVLQTLSERQPPFNLSTFAEWSADVELSSNVCSNSTLSASSLVNFSQVGSLLSTPFDAALLDAIDGYVAKQATMWVFLLNLIKNLLAVFATLLLCSYTDVGGRKIGLVVSTLGLLIHVLMYIVVMYLCLPPHYLLIGAAADGLAGSTVTFTALSFAYLTDVLPEKQWSARFLLLHSLLNVASGLTTIATGYMLKACGFLITTWSIFGFVALSLLYIVLILRDSFLNVDAAGQKSDKGVKLVLSKCLQTLRMCCSLHPNLTTRRVFFLGMASVVCASVINYGRLDIDTLFLTGKPLYLDNIQLGNWLGIRSFLFVVGELVTICLFLKKTSDSLTASLSALSGTIGNIVQGFSTNITVVYISAVVQGFDAVLVPINRAIVTKSLERDEQGSLQALFGIAEATTSLISGILLNGIYYGTLGWFRGFIFMVMAAFYLTASCLMGAIYIIEKKSVISLEKVPESSASDE